MNLNVLVRTFGTQVSRLVPAFVQASFVLTVFLILFSSQKTLAQVMPPVVDGFQYPFDSVGVTPENVEYEVLERINPATYTVPAYTNIEKNEMYPTFVGPNPIRNSAGYAYWYNYDDVGHWSVSSGKGGIHPGEDWNYGGVGDDIGLPAKVIGDGVVYHYRKLSLPVSKSGWCMVIQHLMPDSTYRYSFYMHVTSKLNTDGTVCENESDFALPVGTVVHRGDIIARIANVTSFSSHLHFEIRTHFNAGTDLWPNGLGGLYPNRDAAYALSMTLEDVWQGYFEMQTDGIIDPSDFIDAHRPSTYTIDPEPECGGPAITWQNTIGGSENDRPSSIIQTLDGGYLVGGSSYSGISGDKEEPSFNYGDYWIVKLDANGQIEWQNSIGGNGDDNLTSIQQTADGGYIVGGYSGSGSSGDKAESCYGYNDYWVLKLDEYGVIQWQNTIGGSSDDQLKVVQETSDGGYILGGTSLSGISVDKTEASRGGEDYWIVKLNSLGSIQWDKTIGGSGIEDFTTIKQMPDGNFLIGGYSLSEISGDKTEGAKGGADYWIVKLNSTGSLILWQETLGGSAGDLLDDLALTIDGGFIVSGHSASNVSADKTQASKGVNDYWLVKFNSSYVVEWDKTFGGSNQEWYPSITQTSTGDYFVGGSSSSGISGDKCESSLGVYDVWMLKLGPTGNILWQNTVGGFNSEEQKYGLTSASDGGVVFAVRSASNVSGDKTEPSLGYDDFWVVKLGGDTIVEPNCEADSIPFGIAWQNTIGGSAEELFYTVDATSDGGFILGGVSTSSVSLDKTSPAYGGEDYWIVKIDECGTKEWDQSYGGTNGDVLSQVKQTSDGGYILGGYSLSGVSGNKTEALVGSTDYWVIKTDALGTIEWQNTIGGTSVDELYSIDETSDGGYILAGNSRSNIGGDKTENHFGGLSHDVWVVKLNSFGSIVWQNNIGGTNYDWTGSITENSDGSFILATTSSSSASVDKSEGNQDANGGLTSYDMWIVKMSSTGSIVWENTIGGNDNDWAMQAYEVADGYIVGGYTNSGSSGDIVETPIGGIGNNDCLLIKLNTSGAIVWQNMIGGVGHDYLDDLLVTDDGNYLFSGPSSSSVSGDKTVENFDVINGDLWFVKTNSSGAVTNQNVFGGSAIEMSSVLVKSSDGNFLLASTSTSPVSGNKTEASASYDFWAVKVFDAACAPTAEICNGIDDDCDGSVDEGITVDGFAVSAFGPTTFCQGSSIALAASPTGGTYQWNKNGVPIPGATFIAYTANATGSYTCTTTVPCATATSAPIVVTVNKNPTSNITAGGATTFCPGGSVVLTANAGGGLSYQWYKGANPIAGATSISYTATVSGNFKCRVTKTATGCYKNSNTIAVSATCREGEEMETSVKIYPNPTSGLFTVDIEDATSVSITVSNMLGQIVYEQYATDDRTIDLGGLPRGSYMVTVVSSVSVHSQVIVLE